MSLLTLTRIEKWKKLHIYRAHSSDVIKLTDYQKKCILQFVAEQKDRDSHVTAFYIEVTNCHLTFLLSKLLHSLLFTCFSYCLVCKLGLFIHFLYNNISGITVI